MCTSGIMGWSALAALVVALVGCDEQVIELPPPDALTSAPLSTLSEPVGEVCKPPIKGTATVSGTANPALDSIQFARVVKVDEDETIVELRYQDQFSASECIVAADSVVVLVRLPGQRSRLGFHPVGSGPDAALVQLIEFSDGDELSRTDATNGTVSILGYDPAFGGLCGSLQVDAPLGAASGTFDAMVRCGI